MFDRYFKKVATFQRLLATDDGKEFLKYISEESGAYRPTFSEDPYETAFKEGKRALFNHIVSLTNISPATIQKQIQSAHEEEQLRHLLQGEQN